MAGFLYASGSKDFCAMKRILTILLALAFGMTAFAQFGPGRYGGGMSHGYSGRPGPGHGHGYGYGMGGKLELGFSVNDFTGGNSAYLSSERPDRVGVFGEYRMDLGAYMDMGMQLSTTFGKGKLLYNGFSDDAWFWQGAALVVTDFNIVPYTVFNPYLGIGIGPGFGYSKDKVTGESEWTHALVLAPRAGVELFESLRMSVQYNWYLNDSAKFSHIAFGLSWAFEPGMRGRPMRR